MRRQHSIAMIVICNGVMWVLKADGAITIPSRTYMRLDRWLLGPTLQCHPVTNRAT
jgi:hypothetical protein